MEEKMKHLEFIQGIITKMGQNSFQIKSWTVTIVSALFLLAAKDSNPKFIVVAFFPISIFWLLDSYYLYQERLFRKLYNDVRQQTICDFSLDTRKYDSGFSDWMSAAFSKTIILFYGVIFLTILTVTIKLYCTCK